MSKSRFESSVKAIPYAQQRVYDMLSDLNNLEKIKDKLPEDKVKDLSFDADSLKVKSPVGDISMHIVEREPAKLIKMQTDNSPIPLTLWIQLLPTGEESSKMKLTLEAEVNMFINGMVQKPLTEGVEKIAEALAMIRY